MSRPHCCEPDCPPGRMLMPMSRSSSASPRPRARRGRRVPPDLRGQLRDLPGGRDGRAAAAFAVAAACRRADGGKSIFGEARAAAQHLRAVRLHGLAGPLPPGGAGRKSRRGGRRHDDPAARDMRGNGRKATSGGYAMATGTEDRGGSLSGLTAAEAKEFHRIFMTSFIVRRGRAHRAHPRLAVAALAAGPGGLHLADRRREHGALTS